MIPFKDIFDTKYEELSDKQVEEALKELVRQGRVKYDPETETYEAVSDKNDETEN